MLLQGYSDYRAFLQDEFNNRCRHNPHYSLRAFARDLELSSARLSEVLSKKKGLSREAADQLTTKLKLNPIEAEYFCDLVEVAHARSPVAREAAIARIRAFSPMDSVKNLEMDSFKIVSDWQHFAILGLMHLKEFKSDPSWMGDRLGISHDTVLECLARMIRVQMVKYENGAYKPFKDYVAGPDGIPSEAVRKLHKQLLEKAIVSLETQSVDERDMSSMIIPTSKKKLELAKKRIRDFRVRLNRELSEGSDLDEVYCLSIGFFDLGRRRNAN